MSHEEWMAPIPRLRRLEAVVQSQAEPDVPVMRVDQLDAGVLDSQLQALLRTQLARACSSLPPGFVERYKPEVDALLNLLLFRFTVWVQRPTPGMRLQGLRFRNERGGGSPMSKDGPTRTQRLLYSMLHVGVQWGFARLRRHGLVHGWGEGEQGRMRQRIWRVTQRLERLFRLAWLVNLLLFLRHGWYPTPIDRALGMRMVTAGNQSEIRGINYQFLNRRLLWDHFTDTAIFLAPMVDWGAMRRRLTSLVGRWRRAAMVRLQGLGGAGAGAGGAGGVGGAWGVRGDGRITACVDCGRDPPGMPYVTDCGHVFCYYCLKTATMLDRAFACPRCGHRFARCRRWSPALAASSSSISDGIPISR